MSDERRRCQWSSQHRIQPEGDNPPASGGLRRGQDARAGMKWLMCRKRSWIEMTGGANHGESFLLDRPGVAFVEERLEVALAFARYGILDLLVHEVVVSRPSHRAEDAHWYGVLWVLHTREDVSYRGVFSRFIVNQQVAFGYVVP